MAVKNQAVPSGRSQVSHQLRQVVVAGITIADEQDFFALGLCEMCRQQQEACEKDFVHKASLKARVDGY
jgi:hypothetical protein